jgi:hypothetical protein
VGFAGKSASMLGGHQAGKNLHPALVYDEVMIAAAKRLAPALDDPHTASLPAIDRRELIEVNDAVRDTVDGTVGRLGGEIVEQDDRRIVACKIVLEGEHLTAVAQRTLRQQTDLGQAVDHHPLGLQPLDGVENAPDGFAELEVRRIEQALVVIGIQHAFRRDQLAYDDVVADRPAV